MGGNTLFTVFYFVALIGIMYLIIFLPQKKREKKAREMLNSLKVGYNVTTIGGIAGKIINLKDDEVILETSVEKTQLRLKTWSIKDVEKPLEG